MTMHLLPAYFNDLNNRKKSRKTQKIDFAKLRHEQYIREMTKSQKADKKVLDKLWRQEYNDTMKVNRSDYVSLGMTEGSTPKPEPKVYTGGNLKGIATMHKSNMVPVFNNKDAEDIAKMRR